MRTHRKEDHPNTWAQPNDTVHHKDGWAACWMCEVERLREQLKVEQLAIKPWKNEVERLRVDLEAARTLLNSRPVEPDRAGAASAANRNDADWPSYEERQNQGRRG